MNIGSSYNAHRAAYKIICSKEGLGYEIFPFLRDEKGSEKMHLISPEHGRSYLVSETDDGRFIVSKGNGLSYSQYPFLNTGEMGCGTWGLLLREDALRDYNNGLLAASYGIKTNCMHCVIELDEEIQLFTSQVTILKPVLLQYDVECPYRISDAQFVPKSIILSYVNKWSSRNMGLTNEPKYVIAADTLINNLKIMHDHGFLHNAITTQNYTWALELLDFEMSSSPEFPFDENIDSQKVTSLFNREILHTYQVIIYIAKVLGENADNRVIDKLFSEYGMDLKKLAVG